MTRYQHSIWNPGLGPTVRPEEPIDLRSVHQVGQALTDYADKQAFEEGIKEGTAAQGTRDKYVGDMEGDFFNPAKASGYNKAARVALSANKDLTLKRDMAKLEKDHYLDPQGFQDAAAEYEQNFFADIPPDRVAEYSQMYDAHKRSVAMQIDQRKFANDRAAQAVDIEASMNDITQRIVADTLAKGSSNAHSVELGKWDAYAAQLQALGLATPKQREDLIKKRDFAITQATVVQQVRTGQKVDDLIKQVQDPSNPTFRVLTVDQQQALITDITREQSVREGGFANDRALLNEQFNAQVTEGFLTGKVPETPEAAMEMRQKYVDDMTRFGVDPKLIESNMRKYDDALRLGNQVKTLNVSNMNDNLTQVRAAKIAMNSYQGGDPLEQARLNDEYKALAVALDTKSKAFAANGPAALQMYNPDLYAKQDWTSDAGLLAARKTLQQVTGNPNVRYVPDTIVTGLQTAMAGKLNPDGTFGQADAESKGLAIARIVTAYPDQADEILEAAGLPASDLLAGQMFAAGQTVAAQQLLIAADGSKENRKLVKKEDVDAAFTSAFGEQSNQAMFDDYRQPFADLYAHFARYADPEKATELAKSALMSDRQIITAGGNTLIAGSKAEADKLDKGFTYFTDNLIAQGVYLGKDQNSITPSELKTLLKDPKNWHWKKSGRGYGIQLNDGRAIYVRTNQGRALAVFDPMTGKTNSVPSDPNNRRNAVPEHSFWGSPIKTEPQKLKIDNVPEEARKLYGDEAENLIPDYSIAPVQKFKMEQADAVAARAYQLGVEKGLAADPYLGRINKNPSKLPIVAGAIFGMTGGDAPEWALDALADSNIPEFQSLGSAKVREIVVKNWADPEKRLAPINGRVPDPSEALAIQVEKARQEVLSTYGQYGQGRWRGKKKVRSEPASFESLGAALLQRESSGNYTAVNQFGFSGGYQMGVGALIDAGLMKPEAKDDRRSQKAVMNDAKYWNVPGGLKGFLSDPRLQDQAFGKFTELNLNSLRKLKVIDKNRTPQEVNGWLAVAHLLGAKGAATAKKTGKGVDGNGTHWKTYYNLGAKVSG